MISDVILGKLHIFRQYLAFSTIRPPSNTEPLDARDAAASNYKKKIVYDQRITSMYILWNHNYSSNLITGVCATSL